MDTDKGFDNFEWKDFDLDNTCLTNSCGSQCVVDKAIKSWQVKC